MSDIERLPRGCQMWTEETPSGKAFMYEPCDLRCPNYLFTAAEMKRQGKPTTILDLR